MASSKKFEVMWSVLIDYKGQRPEISLGPFLNDLALIITFETWTSVSF